MFLQDAEEEVDPKTELLNENASLKRLFRIKEIKRLEQRRRFLRYFFIQRQEKNILLRSRENLHADAANIFCKQFAKRDHKCKNHLSRLLDLQTKYKTEINDLELRRSEVIQQINETYRNLCAKRREFAKVIRKSRPTIAKQKQMVLYEGRLEHAKQEYGDIQTKNSKLRDEINHLLIIRSTYEQLYRRFHSQFKECIKIMADHVQEANKSFRLRQDFRFKMRILRERYWNDMKKLCSNQKVLHRMLEKYQITDVFVDIKENHRHDVKSMALRNMVEEGVTGLEEQLQKSREIYHEIQVTSGLEDVKQMQKAFFGKEDEIFTLFTYVNMINLENDEMEILVKDLRTKIESIEKNLTIEQKEARKKIEEDQAKAEAFNEELEKLEVESTASASDVERMIGGIKHLFAQCGCTDEIFLSHLSTKSMSADEMTEYIEILENYVVEMLLVYEYMKLKELGEHEAEKDQNRSSLASESSKHIKGKDPRPVDIYDKMAMKSLEGCSEFLGLEDLKSIATQVVVVSSESEQDQCSDTSSSD